jgi:UDP:flavonoid glycosyltransferase YjiC (YdhE family)
MMPLATAFRERGDEVLWATGESACRRLAEDGFQARVCGLDEPAVGSEIAAIFAEFAALPPEQRPDLVFGRVFAELLAPAMLPDLLVVAKNWPPDLLISDAGEFAGPIVATLLGRPHVTHGFGPLLPEPRVARGARAIAPLWEAEGLTPHPYGGHYDYDYIDIYPPTLPSWDHGHLRSTQLIRPETLSTGVGEGPPEWIRQKHRDLPLVYATFGTVFNDAARLRPVLEALGGLPVRAVITVGPRGDPSGLGAKPDNVHVARYIPQRALLPHCSAVISHAGSGTFLAAAAAGLPQVCLPQGADQFLNATACAEVGAGLNLAPDAVNVGSVRDALARVLSEGQFRAAARQVAAQIAMMPAPAEVADLLARRYGAK